MNGFGRGTVSAQLIETLSRKLYQRYQSAIAPVPQELVGPEQLEKGIHTLLDEHLLELHGATEVSDYRVELLDAVLRAVKQAQAQSGTLTPSGILDQRTLKWLLNRPFGHFHRPRELLVRSTTSSSPDDAVHSVRYYIENDELPSIPSVPQTMVRKLFREAWVSWSECCKIDAKQAGDRGDANVIINNGLLNGHSTNVLAMVDLGPPGNRQLELRFSSAESWTPHKFKATAGHQIGHLLGLHSISEPRQLMNEFLHDDIDTPQQSDIAAAVAIWGKR